MGLSKAQDENSRFHAKAVKPSAGAQQRRAGGALSDITNVAAQPQAAAGGVKVRPFNKTAKKKRLLRRTRFTPLLLVSKYR